MLLSQERRRGTSTGLPGNRVIRRAGSLYLWSRRRDTESRKSVVQQPVGLQVEPLSTISRTTTTWRNTRNTRRSGTPGNIGRPGMISNAGLQAWRRAGCQTGADDLRANAAYDPEIGQGLGDLSQCLGDRSAPSEHPSDHSTPHSRRSPRTSCSTGCQPLLRLPSRPQHLLHLLHLLLM